MKNVVVNTDKQQSVAIAQAPEIQQPVPLASIVLYALLFVAAAIIITYFYSAAILPGVTSVQTVLIPAGCFALAGLLFAAFLYAALRLLSRANYTGGIIYAIVVFASVVAATFLMGLYRGNGSVTTSLFYSGLFVLPFTIYQSWLLYSRLTFYSYNKIYFLPERVTQPPKRATIFLNSIHIKIKIPPVQGGAEYMYETTVPGRMSVGEMFNDVVTTNTSADAANDTFEEVSSGNYGWQFFVPSLLGLGTRIVDAEASLDQNKIKNNGVVIAKRIPGQFAITELTNHN